MTNYQKILTLIKGAKNILVENQMYEDANVFRWLEAILEEEGDKLSDESLQYFYNIVETTRNKISATEKKPRR